MLFINIIYNKTKLNEIVPCIWQKNQFDIKIQIYSISIQMNRFIPARATEGSILIHNTITVPKLHRTPISGYEFLNCTDHDRFPIALLFLVTDKFGFFSLWIEFCFAFQRNSRCSMHS